MSRFFAASIAVILACSCTLTAFAATSTIVRGVITVEGKPTAGVKVTLAGEGSKFDTTTDAKGALRLLADPVRPLRAHGHVRHASAGQRRRDRDQRQRVDRQPSDREIANGDCKSEGRRALEHGPVVVRAVGASTRSRGNTNVAGSKLPRPDARHASRRRAVLV